MRRHTVLSEHYFLGSFGSNSAHAFPPGPDVALWLRLLKKSFDLSGLL